MIVLFALACFLCAMLTSGADGLEPLTGLAQLHQAAEAATPVAHEVRLEGTVLWADPAVGRLVLLDDSEAEELELDWGATPVTAGRRARIAGCGIITHTGSGIRLGIHGAVVNNDGVHGLMEKCGTVHLPAGLQPVRVEWFNEIGASGLEVLISGPELPLQRVPPTTLWREDPTAAGKPARTRGLEFRACAAAGETLPDFARLPVLKNGVCTDFDRSVAPMSEHVAVQFNGFIEIPRAGIYTFHLRSDDGSRLFVGSPAFEVTVLGPTNFPAPRALTVGQPLHPGEDRIWATVEGPVQFAAASESGLRMELGAGATRLQVEVAADGRTNSAPLSGRVARVTGFCRAVITPDGQRIPGMQLVPDMAHVQWIAPPENSTAAPDDADASHRVLRTAAEVHRLKREEAQRGHPVWLRGVVTCVLPERQAVVLQDSTRGIYFEDVSTNGDPAPRIGDLLDVEGTSDPSLFAPIVRAHRITRLGIGPIPAPAHPTLDLLKSGSLDAQYVELSGVITEVRSNSISLLTRDGLIEVELRIIGMDAGRLKHHENARVRLRGCFLASWDYQTHQVREGVVRLFGASLQVDQPAPADLFSTSEKSAAELRLFDPQAGLFQRTRVQGQVLLIRGREVFMNDHGAGLRCLLRNPQPGFAAGDVVEVVGFPEFTGGAAPVLRESVARRTGHAPLPEPVRLDAADLADVRHDASRVRVEALLVERRKTDEGWSLDLQSGMRLFTARWTRPEIAPPDVEIGSRVEVDGVFANIAGQRASGQGPGAFEILLNAADDIRVLARPPWWTLGRLLGIVGLLSAILVLATLWITQLHRQVEQRGAALEKEIRARQHIEQQQALDQERARVARDLHDELGSDLTEVTMLLARAGAAGAAPERRDQYLEQTGAKARQMVTALDEIVWAMNPRHDSLGSLTSYFCLHADRFLGLAGISWKLEASTGAAEDAVDSRRRHQLFLAFKEALTNVVRHAHATEVRFSVGLDAGIVLLTVTDNGRGLSAAPNEDGMDGVSNLRARCEKLGGTFEIQSQPDRGTTVRFRVPAH